MGTWGNGYGLDTGHMGLRMWSLLPAHRNLLERGYTSQPGAQVCTPMGKGVWRPGMGGGVVPPASG